MTFVPTPTTCGLHGDAGCYRRFMHSPRPRYIYAKRRTKIEGSTCVVRWCTGVHPKPQPVTNEKCAHCADWRDVAGRGAEEVRAAIAAGAYKL